MAAGQKMVGRGRNRDYPGQDFSIFSLFATFLPDSIIAGIDSRRHMAVVTWRLFPE